MGTAGRGCNPFTLSLPTTYNGRQVILYDDWAFDAADCPIPGSDRSIPLNLLIGLCISKGLRTLQLAVFQKATQKANFGVDRSQFVISTVPP